MNLDLIPHVAQRPPDAVPSETAARLRSVRPQRRMVLKGLLMAAATSTLVTLDWLTTKSKAAADGPTTEHLNCVGVNYTPDISNWWSGWQSCLGGYRRGNYPCSAGFHREGSWSCGDEAYSAYRITSDCLDRNAWRWQGKRCSDAQTETVWDDGSRINGLTVAECWI